MSSTTISANGVPALRIDGVTKGFGATVALKPLDLEIARGEIHALVGENGSGKSTFIKLLAGYHSPDEGEALVDGQPLKLGSADSANALGIRFVHQDLGLIPELSVEDNLHLTHGFPSRFGTLRAKALRARAEKAIARLNMSVDPAELVATLSPAQRTGVAVARALMEDEGAPVRVIVMDEPTATLPQDEVSRLLDLVRDVAAQDVAVIYVTHRLDELFGFADRVTVLRDGVRQATLPMGGLSRREIVNLMVGAEFDEAHAEAQVLETVEHVPLLKVSGLDSAPLRDVSMTVASGEIVGIAGLTGSGRETMLAAIFGGTPREGGEVYVEDSLVPPHRPDAAVKLGVGYVPPDRKVSGALLELTARENLVLPSLRSLWRFPFLRKGTETREAQHWFEELDVRPRDGLGRELSTFSGGNQQKVVLAKWLRIGSRVLLLDEPTQGVDVGAKAVIYRHLVKAAADGACVVIASSDSDELAAICHRVLVLQDGQLASELVGDAVTTKNIGAGVLGGSVQGAGNAVLSAHA
jgi:ribose transport system ATP-binding protein